MGNPIHSAGGATVPTSASAAPAVASGPIHTTVTGPASAVSDRRGPAANAHARRMAAVHTQNIGQPRAATSRMAAASATGSVTHAGTLPLRGTSPGRRRVASVASAPATAKRNAPSRISSSKRGRSAGS